MLSSAGSKNGALDIDYHLQSANLAFFANKSIFLSRNVSIRNKLKFFDAIVTPIACFGAGPRCIHAADMDKFDIHFRRLIRCVVGAPAGICWHDPWHEILHIWNQRVREMVEVCHMKTWAETCASQQWKFAGYIMSLPPERWVRRMLHWQPIGRGPVGRPAMNWTSKFEQFSRIKRWDDWKNVATDADRWMATTQTFAPQQAHTSAATSVRLSRLRRLWRRHQEFCHHQRHSLSAASKHLRHNIITEARQLGFRGNPIDSSQLLEAEQWISQQISNEEDAQQQARIQHWRRKLQPQDKHVWKWLARGRKGIPLTAAKTSSGHIVGGDELIHELETFWRTIWPKQHDLPDLPTLQQTAPAWPNTPLPAIAPLTGAHLRRIAADQEGKTSGPDGWTHARTN